MISEITIENDYIKIGILGNQIKAAPYNSPDVEFELEDVFYHSSGYKYVICKRSEIEVGRKRLLQPDIDKLIAQIKPLQFKLDTLLNLL